MTAPNGAADHPDPATAGRERTVPAPREPGSARFLFGATTLVLEMFVVLFGALVAFGLRLAPTGWILGGALALTVIAIVALALLRTRAGWAIGTALQVLLLATALVLPAMAAAALVFGAMWVVSWIVGGRVDVERRERHSREMSLWRAGAPPYDEPHVD